MTDTGQATQMGRIADMVNATQRVRSPLQRELDGMTKIFGLHRVDGGHDHRGHRDRAWPGHRDAPAALHLDRDLGDSRRSADVRADDAVVGRAASRRVQGGREVAHRRRDPRWHHGHQQRQDRHADHERDDRDHDARRRAVVPDRRRRLREDRRDPRRRRGRGAGLLAPGPRARALVRRDRRRRRIGHRRPDRSRVRGARGQDGSRRRGDPCRAPAPGRGAVRLRVQVHGDVPRPSRVAQRRRARRHRTS